jgi:hypothetical protein
MWNQRNVYLPRASCLFVTKYYSINVISKKYYIMWWNYVIKYATLLWFFFTTNEMLGYSKWKMCVWIKIYMSGCNSFLKNSEFFKFTDKNIFFILEWNEMHDLPKQIFQLYKFTFNISLCHNSFFSHRTLVFLCIEANLHGKIQLHVRWKKQRSEKSSENYIWVKIYVGKCFLQHSVVSFHACMLLIQRAVVYVMKWKWQKTFFFMCGWRT